MPLRLLIAAAASFVGFACGEAPPDYGPEADAAREFRPLGDVFFLPDRVPVVTNDGAAKVPDSKIEWNVRAKLHDVGLKEIEVEVDEQVVELRGRVSDPTARQTVEELALGVHGVAGVRNKLEVGQ